MQSLFVLEFTNCELMLCGMQCFTKFRMFHGLNFYILRTLRPFLNSVGTTQILSLFDQIKFSFMKRFHFFLQTLLFQNRKSIENRGKGLQCCRIACELVKKSRIVSFSSSLNVVVNVPITSDNFRYQ